MDGKAHINTLPKKERLHGKKDIESLLVKGRYGSYGGFRYRYSANSMEYSRILISVPKKSFKRAVRRNLLKRRIRESWRKLKGSLASPHMDILFMYTSKEVLTYEDIYSHIEQIICKLNEHTDK